MNRRPTFQELRSGARTLEPTTTVREPERLTLPAAPQIDSTMGPNLTTETPSHLTVTNRSSDWLVRLAREFGWGSRPDLRRKFYERVQLLAATHQDLVERLAAEARMQSYGKRDRGAYFCRALALKLLDHRVVEGGQLDAW